jgi:replicative DNA helicase
VSVTDGQPIDPEAGAVLLEEAPPAPAGLPPFPVGELPPPLSEFCAALAEATQTPVDMPAVLALASVAACAQGRVAVQVKPGYVEPVTLQALVVADPGTRKSAVNAAVTAPIVRWERDEAARLGPEIERARTERAIKEKRRDKLQDQAARADDPGGRADLSDQAARLAAELAATPARAYPRVVADDVTPEAAARLMAEQGGRLAILSAEGGIFETAAGRYANGVANLDIFLKGHAGDVIRVDRRNGPPIVIDAPALTLGLAVQPDVMRSAANKPGFRGRGLLARFLYAAPPSMLGHRRQDSSPVPDSIRLAYEDVIRRLLALEPRADGSLTILELSRDARVKWAAFAARLEPRLGAGGDLGHLADWAGKAAGAAARIAGLMHVVRCAGDCTTVEGPIPGSTMLAAVVVVEGYFIPHAMAAFSDMSTDPEVAAAQAVVAWAMARGMEELSVRNAHVALRGQARFKLASAVARACSVAEEMGLLRRLPDSPKVGAGRPPSPRYAVSFPASGKHLGSRSPATSGGAGAGSSVDSANVHMKDPGTGPPSDGATMPARAVPSAGIRVVDSAAGGVGEPSDGTLQADGEVMI